MGNSGAKSAGAHLHFEVQTSYIPQGENVDDKLNTTGREVYTVNPSAHLNAEYTHGTVTKDVYPTYDTNYDTKGGPPADWAPPDGANWPEVENVPGGTLAPWDCVEYDPEREQQLVKDPQAMIQV